MNNQNLILLILVISLVTAAIRFLPFTIFRGGRPIPKFIEYLGEVLPYAVMGMLVVYCLRNINFATTGSWLPEIIASLVVVFIHVWRRNSILSIIVGTASYMFLVQVIFA